MKITAMSGIRFGPTGSAYYDPDLHGAVIPMVAGIDEADSLRSVFPSTGGEVWVQWEMHIHQDWFNDLPVTLMKTGLQICLTYRRS